MIIFVIIIAAIVVWYCISAEKEHQKELVAKVKEAEAAISRVESSPLYEKIDSYIQSEISNRVSDIRKGVARDYNSYLRSNSDEKIAFPPDYKRYKQPDHINIFRRGLDGFSSWDDSHDIDFSELGYIDLSDVQLYALFLVLHQHFSMLTLQNSSTIEQLQSRIFEKHDYGYSLYLSDSYIESIVNSEIKQLQNQKPPYESAF